MQTLPIDVMKPNNLQSPDLFEMNDEIDVVSSNKQINTIEIESTTMTTANGLDVAVRMQIVENKPIDIGPNESPLVMDSVNVTPQNHFGPSIGFDSAKINIAQIIEALVSQQSDDHHSNEFVPFSLQQISVDELIQAHSMGQDNISRLIADVQQSS